MGLLIDVIQLASNALVILILARVLLSWVQPANPHPVLLWIHRVTEPVLAPVRNLLPAMGGLDLSPIVVLFGIQIAEQLLIRVLVSAAY